MNYTQLPIDQLKSELLKNTKCDFDFTKAVADPSYFAHHVLGLTPYHYQHAILKRFRDDALEDNSRMIVCKPRQIGISICVAMLAIWYAGFNKANNGQGSGVSHNTKVGIISKTDKQALKLMREIYNLVKNSKHGFAESIMRCKDKNLTKSEINFEQGWIKSYPPTDSCRGETLDLVIVDEAAFVEDMIFNDAIEPTVSKVNGKIILSSTPKGQSGFFFEHFDPFDVRREHEYERFWFFWEMCDDDVQKKIIIQKLKYSKETGNMKSFDQEYNALFTVDQSAFFEDADVETGVDRNLIQVYESKLPVAIAIDYGMTTSETSISVVALLKNRVELLFQFSQTNLDDNLLTDLAWENSIQNLNKRYPNLIHLVVDDCAQGHRTNLELEKIGYPVFRFNFRSDAMLGERSRGYYVFRAALKQNRVKYPEIKELMAEMKCIQEVKMAVNVRIKAPDNYLDDRCDSLVMACYPFLMEEEQFSSELIDSEKKNQIIQSQDERFDFEWEKLKNVSNPYEFLLGDIKIDEGLPK